MNPQILQSIKDAAKSQKILKIIYLEKDGTSEGWRYVEPYSFRGDGESEALFAWDINKNGIRRFTLNNIQQTEITESVYIPRYPIEIL